jgi:hypothetical protein
MILKARFLQTQQEVGWAERSEAHRFGSLECPRGVLRMTTIPITGIDGLRSALPILLAGLSKAETFETFEKFDRN